MEAYGSIIVGTVIVNEGEVVRPAQLIASVGRTYSGVESAGGGMKARGSCVWLLLATAACGLGDDRSDQILAGTLTADPIGMCGRHTFNAKRDGQLTIWMVELRCGVDPVPEISVVATMDGIGYLSGNMHPGDSMSQNNGSAGAYEIAVCLGRIRYAECQYKVAVSQ